MDRASLAGHEDLAAAALSLPFRSNRDYVHSTDIFQSVTALARERWGPDAYLTSLVLRRTASHQLRVSFEPERHAIGTFAIRDGSDEISGALVETDEAVLRRVPYDESRIIAAAVAGEHSASFASLADGYTAFEHLVVALKIAAGDVAGHAWLCQVKLLSPLLESAPLAVSVRQKLRLFHGFEIQQHGKPIGSACAASRS